MRNIIKGSASYIILDTLEKAVDTVLIINDLTTHSAFYAYGTGSQHLKKSTISQALKRLKEGKLIEVTKVNDEMLFKLTSLGKDLIGNGPKEEKWDGKWRIVSFDIPEQKRIVRNLLRRNLKRWGFKYLHKSVWVSKRNVYDKIKNYTKDLGIEHWVTVIEADKISTDLS